MADKEERAAYYAGMIRNELGEKLDLIEKNAYRFCYVNDFPMFEKDPETKKIGFTHNPFSMPQGGLEALNTMDRWISWLTSTISSATVWNYLPELCVTTICRSWKKHLRLQVTTKKY